MANIASGGWWRLEDDGTLYVYCSGDMPYSDSRAPWWDYREQITSATISNGVTNIGIGAFNRCSNLVSVVIPNGVTSIGKNAFYECATLVNVTIPDGVTSIGDAAFIRCTVLVSVTIPDSVTSIGKYAFTQCYSIESIIIPDGVTSIGTGTFTNCTSLANITIPDSVTSIGNSAFKYDSLLADVYYSGTEVQWNTISIDSDNTPLTSATIHYAAPTPGSATLSSIAVTAQPIKTAYTAGETFSPTGMVIAASYSDETTAVVTNYNISPSGALTTSDSAVTVSYTENGVTVTATVNITVTEPTPGPEPEPEPQPEPVAAGLINYTGQSKVIRRLCATVNQLYATRPRLFVDGDGYICADYGGEESNHGE